MIKKKEEKSYKSSSLLPGKIGVRNASETTTELLKYPELPGPWTLAVRDLALCARVVSFAHKNDGILTFPIN